MINNDADEWVSGWVSDSEPADIESSSDGWVSGWDVAPKEDAVKESPGVLSTVGKGLAHGGLGLAESVGTGVEYLGNRIGSEAVSQAGETAKKYWGEKAQSFKPSQAIEGKNVWDNPEILKNSEFWLYNIADMVPALSASVVPGVAAYKGISAISAIPKLAKIGGAIAGGLSGGALEGTQTYNAVLEKGGTEEEAARAAELMTAGSGALNALSIGNVLSKAGTTFKGKVLKHLGSAAWEGITEGLEEPTEVFSKYFGSYLAGQPLPTDLEDQLIQSAKDALTVAPIAAVTGFGGSVLGSGTQPDIATALKTGDDQALDQELDKILSDQDQAPAPFADIQDQTENLPAMEDEEYKQWEAEIQRQRQPKPQRELTPQEINQAMIGMTEAIGQEIENIPETDGSEWVRMEDEANADADYWNKTRQEILKQREPKRQPTTQEIMDQKIAMTEDIGREIKDVPEVRSGYSTEQEKLNTERNIFLQKLDQMQNEVNGSRTRGVTQERINQPEAIAFPADSPEWMREVQEARKKDGKPALGRADLNTLFDKVRSGKPLTENQQDQFNYVQIAAQKYAGPAGEMVAQEEADSLEKRGFDLLGGRKMEVVNFGQGDRIVATVDGVKDEYLVKDMDENGKVILEDGVTRRVDLNDEISVEAHKPATHTMPDGTVMPGAEHIGPVDQFTDAGKMVDAEKTPMTVGKLNKEVTKYRGKGGISTEVRKNKFFPGFRDSETGEIYPSLNTDGSPAGIHLLDGLPESVITERNKYGDVTAAKSSLESGFIRDGKFYTRSQAIEEQKKPADQPVQPNEMADEETPTTAVNDSNQLPDVPEADFGEMVKEAARWKGAAMKIAERLSLDKKAALRHSQKTTKGDLDKYLMGKFGLDEADARAVSNELTAKNIPADMSASIDEFKTEPWAQGWDESGQTKKEMNAAVGGFFKDDAQPDITNPSGKPFTSKGNTIFALKRAKADKTHEPVQVEGGWVGREIKYQTLPSAPESDKVKPADRLKALFQSKKEKQNALRNNQRDKTSSDTGGPTRQRLRRAIAQVGDPDKAKITIPSNQKERALQKLAKALGIKPVYFRTTDTATRVTGFYFPGTDEVFINLSSGSPINAVFGHELVHYISDTHPDLYDYLVKEFKNNRKDYFKYALKENANREAAGLENMSDEQMFEEFIADFANDSFQRPEFWDKLYKKSPSMFQTLVDSIKKIFGKIKSVLTRSEQYILDVDKAQNDLASVVSEAMRRAKESSEKTGTDKAAFQTAPATESKAFRDWFGESVVTVDGKAGSEPLVVYHGTANSFNAFDKGKIHMGVGFFFTPSKRMAQQYADKYVGKGKGTLMPVYLSAKKFIDLSTETGRNVSNSITKSVADAEGRHSRADYIAEAQRRGYDGRLLLGGLKGGEIEVFEPTQIKSVFNSGTFDPKNPDIRYQVMDKDRINTFKKWVKENLPGFKGDLGKLKYGYDTARTGMEAFDLSDDSTFKDWAVYNNIDMLAPGKKIRAAIEKESGAIPEHVDAIQKEMLRISKTAKDQKIADEKYFTPIRRLIALSRKTVKEVGEYLYARHAPEANARLRLTNARLQLKKLIQLREDSDINQEVKAARADLKIARARLLTTEKGTPEHKAAVEQAKTAKEALDQTKAQNIGSNLEKEMAVIDAMFEKDPFGTRQELYLALLERELKNPLNEQEENFKARWEAFKKKPSGMTDKEASEINDKYKDNKIFQKIAVIFDRMNQDKLDILRASGRISKQEYAGLKSTFKYYAPLHREGYDSRPGRGRGISAIGKDIKTRGGSTKRAVDILAHAFADYEASLIKTHKTEVARAFLQMVRNYPNENVWQIETVKKVPGYDDSGNLVEHTDMSEQDNEIKVKIDGKVYSIVANNIHSERLIKALKNDTLNTGVIVQGMARINRFLAMVNTSLSPLFIPMNFLRDFQMAMINLSDTAAEKYRGQIIKDIFPAMAGMKSLWRGDKSHPFAKWADRFEKAGGKISWMDFEGDIKTRVKNLEKEINLYRDGHVTQKSLEKLKRFVEDYNGIVENAVRLATFKACIDAGMSESKAALFAKELTVNFQQKGVYSQLFNSLYLFYNAGVQGSVKVVSKLLQSPKARKIAGGAILAAAALSIANRGLGGDDDDGIPHYDKITAFEKERNMIFMAPWLGKGAKLKFPLPWGFNVFWGIGTELGDMATKKNYDITESMANILQSAFGAFNPLQSSTLLQTMAPTLMDPFVQVGENKTWSGSPLMPENSPFAKVKKPDSELYFSSARKPSIWLAAKLNSIFGGNAVRSSGITDISPETLDLVIDTFTGSAGKFAVDLGMAPFKALSGGMPLDKAPFISKFYSKKSEYADMTLYRENIDRVFERVEEIEVYPENKRLKEDRIYTLNNAAKQSEKRISKLNKQLKKATTDEQKKRYKELINKERMNFNSKYYKLITEGKK